MTMQFNHMFITTITTALLITLSTASAVIVQPGESTSEDTFTYEFEGGPPPGLANLPMQAFFPNILGAISSTVGHDQHTLIRFDLSSLISAPLYSATLNLYVADITTVGFPAANPDAANPVVVEVHANNSAFVEATATWNNAPAFGGIEDSLSIDGFNQWVSFDVKALVESWRTTPANNYGFQLTGDGTLVMSDGDIVGVVFDSSNATNKPYLAITYIPDFNTDGYVDGADFSFFLGQWGAAGSLGPADFNNDNVVDGADFSFFLGQWNPPGPPVLDIPEPATVGFMACGLTVMLLRRVRR